VKRTAEKTLEDLTLIIQPSASRTSNSSVPFPSSELLGYYHSSALRTEQSYFSGKASSILGCDDERKLSLNSKR